MRKNLLTMELLLTPDSKAEQDLVKFRTRLEVKMEGKLHAKEDTFTLAYVIMEKIRRKMLGVSEGQEEFAFELSYEAAAALAYEIKTYPARPREGLLIQILVGLDQGLREKKQHDRERNRKVKQRDRPTVRESRGI